MQPAENDQHFLIFKRKFEKKYKKLATFTWYSYAPGMHSYLPNTHSYVLLRHSSPPLFAPLAIATMHPMFGNQPLFFIL